MSDRLSSSGIAREEVGAVPPPPRARVGDAPDPAGNPVDDPTGREAFQRKRDYLEGFLAETRSEASPGAADDDLREAIIGALKEIYDPEIPVNIYDLGLIYDVIVDEGHARVRMTLTTPHCPVAESMPGEVEMRVAAVPGVGVVDVDLVWDPPWSPANMTDEARLELGML